MNFIFSILGIVGGILGAVADCLLDLKGADNEKLGTSKNIDSNWLKMSEWRFEASILFIMIACPLAGLGIISIANQVEAQSFTLAMVLKLGMYVGVMGGMFIHSILCIQPIIYKRIMKTNQFELADDVLEGFYKAVTIPFFVLFVILAFVPTIGVIVAIVKGYLNVPMWMVLFNPVVTQVVGWILRAANRKLFYDAPAIFMANIGMALWGVVGIVNLL